MVLNIGLPSHTNPLSITIIMDAENSSMDASKINDEKIEKVEQDVCIDDDSAPKSKLEKRLLLKQDLIILPLLSMTFFFAYLVRATRSSTFTKLTCQDRGQIGNARIMGLQKSYNITNAQYFNCLMMFCM